MSYYGYAFQEDIYSYPSYHHYDHPSHSHHYGNPDRYDRDYDEPRRRGYVSYSDRSGFGGLGNPFEGMGDRFNGARHRFGGAMRGAGRRIGDFGQDVHDRGLSYLYYMQDRYNEPRGRKQYGSGPRPTPSKRRPYMW